MFVYYYYYCYCYHYHYFWVSRRILIRIKCLGYLIKFKAFVKDAALDKVSSFNILIVPTHR